MMDKLILRCVVITPESQAVDAEATDVVLPAHDGLLGVLPGHAPFLCKLGTGLLRYRDLKNQEQRVFIENGFGHIRDNEVSILTTNAITKEDIDTSAAEAKLHEAQTMPTTTIEEVQDRNEAIQRAQYLQQLTSASSS
jgi:F-type H+-transporting ATPase subunit epsilon